MMYWLYQGWILRLAKPSIYSNSNTPHLLQKSDKPLQESSHLQFFMSNNTFTPRISCSLNQFLQFFSELGAGMGCRLTAREMSECNKNRVLWVQTGLFSRLCHAIRTFCHSRMGCLASFLIWRFWSFLLHLWRLVARFCISSLLTLN